MATHANQASIFSELIRTREFYRIVHADTVKKQFEA